MNREQTLNADPLFRIGAAAALACCFALGQNAAQARAARDLSEQAMLADPRLDTPTREVSFDSRLIPLWEAAMQRPEFDLRADAIEAFARAHKEGVSGLEVAIPSIRKSLAEDPQPYVRLSAARALIELDDRASADALLAACARADIVTTDMTCAVDAALVRWAYAPAGRVWIERLKKQPRALTETVSAIQCLSRTGAAEAVGPLLASVLDEHESAAIRMEAAKALGQIESSGLLPEAQRLASSGRAGESLTALAMLENHSGAEAVDLVRKLASDPDARVRAHAIGILTRVDSHLVASAYAIAARDTDDGVRLEVIRAFAASPSEAGISSLITALADPSQPVRTTASAAMIQFSLKSGLDEQITRAVQDVLDSAGWREVEQGCRIAGTLRMSDAAPKLITLLSAERAEVRLAAATALRQIASKENLPAILQRAELLTTQAAGAAANPERFESIGQEAAQLLTAIGEGRYQPASALMMRYIPKHSHFHPTARGAALYALGKIHEGEPDAELVKAFESRISDNNPIDPEAADVRRFAAIGLARMHSSSSLPTLREFYEAENSTVSVGGACRWAIMQLEHVELPPLKPLVHVPGPFFLEPIRRREGAPTPAR